MSITQKVVKYFLAPRFHFNRIEFNFLALVFMASGLVVGMYASLSGKLPQIFALNDTAKVWTFDASTASDYTTSLTTIDNNGAQPTGGAVGANEFTNPAYASDNSSWSVAALPSAGWAEVPGNATYSTTNFLAMKYEAKYDCTADDDGDTAAACSATADSGLGLDYRDISSFDNANVVSTANGAPIVHITHTQAVSACPTGSHLINNDEWMTMVRNAELQTTNWADGTLGSLVSASGGMYRGNVGSLDSVGYKGTDPEYGTGRDTKAMLALSNGSEFWDLSGNVWNHVNFDGNSNGVYNEADDLLSQQDQPEATDGTTTRTGFSWSGFTSADPVSTWYLSNNGSGDLSYDDFRPLGSTLTALNGMGRIYHDSNSSTTTKNRVLAFFENVPFALSRNVPFRKKCS